MKDVFPLLTREILRNFFSTTRNIETTQQVIAKHRRTDNFGNTQTAMKPTHERREKTEVVGRDRDRLAQAQPWLGTHSLGWCRVPRLARLLEALGAIRSTRLTDDNHLGSNVVTNTLETRDKALRALTFTTIQASNSIIVQLLQHHYIIHKYYCVHLQPRPGDSLHLFRGCTN